MKTNKSYTKRIKITKTGKLISRRPGHNHFNAKAKRSKQMEQNRPQQLHFKNKMIGRYLSNLV